MAAPEGNPIPTELAERWAEYIEPSRRSTFKEVCTKATIENVSDALRPFFATWTTSLMDSDLDKLKSLCTEPLIRALIEILVIQDECNTLDPFAVPDLPSSDSTFHIWPRDNAGMVITSKIGVAELGRMLRERLFCPSTIIIREYRIEPINMLLCEEFARFRPLIRTIPQAVAEPLPLAALARDAIEGANLDLLSLVFRHCDPGYGENSVLSSAAIRERFPNGISVGSPLVREAVIEADTAYLGGVTRFSRLRSACVQLGQEAQFYWLQQIFYKATELRALKLSLEDSQDQQLEAEMVVPNLTGFSLGSSRISANVLLAMIASSKESLAHITFLQVVLDHGSTWREVLTSIAKEYHALTSFTLAIIREANGGGPAVDFRDFKDEDIPEQCRAGLTLTPKGPVGNKRVTRLAYSGIDAGKVLEIIAAMGSVPDSYELGRGQREPSADKAA